MEGDRKYHFYKETLVNNSLVLCRSRALPEGDAFDLLGQSLLGQSMHDDRIRYREIYWCTGDDQCRRVFSWTDCPCDQSVVGIEPERKDGGAE